MSAPSGVSRQIARIARLLGVAPDQVTGLDGLTEPELRALHDQISAALFADARARFARVAGLSKTLPAPVAGKLAERFLPPVLAARVTELLEPARARDLVDRVSIRYLGDISIALDPVRSREVVAAIPAARIGEVAGELFRRGEHAVMAEFVGTIGLEGLTATVRAARPRDLLTLVPLVEWSENLEHVFRHLPEAQVRAINAELAPDELAALNELTGATGSDRFGPAA
jgi:hypothetical protein